jgi:twitching motility two-component system response regulator PilG
MVGSDEYLTKPFSKDSLLKAVETHLAVANAAQGYDNRVLTG